MSVTDTARPTDARESRAETLTPTFGQAFRRWRFWLVTVGLVLAAVLAWNLISAEGRDTTPFGANNSGPDGARALTEVLRQQGVDVRVATTIDDARRLAADSTPTTLLLNDPYHFLDEDRLEALDRLASTTVLMAPDVTALDALAPGVALGGEPQATDALEAGCSEPAAARAGKMTPSDSSVQSAGADEAGSVRFCFTDGSGRSQIASAGRDGRSVVVVAGATPFDNENITREGNAALALGLLGTSPTVVWYEPGLEDVVSGESAPTPAELTPEWVTPVLSLLVLVGLAAALWRGRRLGPLVVENLPVVVRAGETIEGRARLYRRSSARLRALDSLRVGTVRRLATALGLPRSADVDSVIHETVHRLGSSEARVRAVLVDDIPGTDADLVDSAAALSTLETEVRAALSRSLTGPTAPDSPIRSVGDTNV